MDDWVLWVIAAGALAVGEIVTLGFFLGPLAVAALVAAVVALVGGGVALQLVVFIAGGGRRRSLSLRPIARRHLHTPRAAAHRRGRAGRQPRAWCSSGWTRDGGRVKIGGEVWTRPRLRRGRGDRARRRGSRCSRSTAPRRSSRNRRYWHVATLIVLVVVAVRGPVHAVARDPDRAAGARRRSSSGSGRYHRTLDAGLALVVPFVDRRQAADRPARAGRLVPAAAGDHRGQPRRPDRHGHLLPGHRPEGGDLRDRRTTSPAIEQLTVTTLRNVIGGMTLEETLTSRDEINAALRDVLDEATGKWGIRVNRVELKAIDPPASIQEAMEKQMRAERDRRAAILTAEGVKQSQILTAEGEKQSAILRAEGRREAQILRGRGPGEGDRDGLRRRSTRGDADPKLLAYQYLQMLPQIAAGRVEQGLDHPERDHPGAGQPRRGARRRGPPSTEPPASPPPTPDARRAARRSPLQRPRSRRLAGTGAAATCRLSGVKRAIARLRGGPSASPSSGAGIRPGPRAACSLSRDVRHALRPPPGGPRRRPLPRQADRGRREQGDAPGAPGAARGRRELQGRQGVHRRGEGARARPGRARLPQPGPAGREDRLRGAHRADGRLGSRARLREARAHGDPDGRPPGLGQDHRLRQARRAPARGARHGRGAWPPATCTGPPPWTSS